MRPSLLILFAIVAVGVVVGAAVFTTRIPDANEQGPNAIGYVDITVQTAWQLDQSIMANGVCPEVGELVGCQVAPTGIKMFTDEHLNTPNAPATFLAMPRLTLTADITCKGKVAATVVGPGRGTPVTTESLERDFSAGDTTKFPFGHLYLNEEGEVAVKLQFYA